MTAPLDSPHHSSVIHMDHANKINLSQYIIAMERLRVCYGRVPKLCTTGKLDRAETWEGNRNKYFLLFPQASLLFSSLQAPKCFSSQHHCKTQGLLQCQITSGCWSFHHPALPSCCPDVLHNFFPPSPSFLSCQIFSPVHSAATATFLHPGYSNAEARGNSWECPCIPCFSPVYSHCSTSSDCDKQLCCSIRNICKSGLHSYILLDVLKISTASSSEEAIWKQVSA